MKIEFVYKIVGNMSILIQILLIYGFSDKLCIRIDILINYIKKHSLLKKKKIKF